MISPAVSSSNRPSILNHPRSLTSQPVAVQQQKAKLADFCTRCRAVRTAGAGVFADAACNRQQFCRGDCDSAAARKKEMPCRQRTCVEAHPRPRCKNPLAPEIRTLLHRNAQNSSAKLRAAEWADRWQSIIWWTVPTLQIITASERAYDWMESTSEGLPTDRPICDGK
jgi:hypothetical protein